MHQLRKIVFADTLNWDVPVEGDIERDRYDEHSPVYLLWCSPDRQHLYGSIRLLPTTGPTLLYDVFRDTFPEAAALSAPGIWEATRCCIDAEALASHYPQMDQSRAFGLICLAAAEVAFAHGIHTLISNYEPHMRRIYARAGAEIQELGRADGYGRRPVCCGAFAIGTNLIWHMRKALSVDTPLYRQSFIPDHEPEWLAA